MNFEDSNKFRGYEIPKNYFDSLQDNVMQRIALEDNTTKRKKSFAKIIKLLLPAAAAIVIGLFISKNQTKIQIQSSSSYDNFELDLSTLSSWTTFDLMYEENERDSVSADEIADYLQYATINQYMLIENF